MPLWKNEMAAPRWTPTLASRPGETRRDQERPGETRRDEQAHKNGDAARAGIEKLADFRKGPEGNPFTLWTMMRPCATGWRPWWRPRGFWPRPMRLLSSF